MTRRRLAPVFALGVLLLTGLACTENPVGRRCFVGNVPDGGIGATAIVSSPALECPSRTCLRQPLQGSLPEGSQFADLCTADCSTAADCDRVPESPCVSGFTCAIPVVVGPFCCRKLCVCKDYLVIPDGGVSEPAACNPDNSANTCCNLAGRESLPECQ